MRKYKIRKSLCMLLVLTLLTVLYLRIAADPRQNIPQRKEADHHDRLPSDHTCTGRL